MAGTVKSHYSWTELIVSYPIYGRNNTISITTWRTIFFFPLTEILPCDWHSSVIAWITVALQSKKYISGKESDSNRSVLL